MSCFIYPDNHQLYHIMIMDLCNMIITLSILLHIITTHCCYRDNEQITPLMQAAMDGHEIIVELLIAYVSVSLLPPICECVIVTPYM